MAVSDRWTVRSVVAVSDRWTVTRAVVAVSDRRTVMRVSCGRVRQVHCNDGQLWPCQTGGL